MSARARMLRPEVSPHRLKCVSFSSEGGKLIGGCTDGNVYVWHLGAGESPQQTIRVHAAGVTTARFAPNHDWVITASMDHTARILGLDGTTLHILAGHEDGVSDAHVAPDGRRAFTASRDGTVRVWILDHDELKALAKERGGSSAW